MATSYLKPLIAELEPAVEQLSGPGREQFEEHAAILELEFGVARRDAETRALEWVLHHRKHPNSAVGNTDLR
jgi:hypothetical protein